MASVASQFIEEVTLHAQSDGLEDAREICADGTYVPNNLRNLNQAWFFHNFEVLVFYIISIALLCTDWHTLLIEWHWLQNSARQDTGGCRNTPVDVLNSLSSVPSYCCGAAWLSRGNRDGRNQDQWVWAGSRPPAVCKQSCYCLSC